MDKEVVIQSYKTLLDKALISDHDRFIPYIRSLKVSNKDKTVTFDIRETPMPGKLKLIEIYNISEEASKILKDFNYAGYDSSVMIELDELAQLLVVMDLAVIE